MKAIIYSEKILWQRFKVAHSVDHYTGSMTQSLIEVVVIETQVSRQWLEGDVNIYKRTKFVGWGFIGGKTLGYLIDGEIFFFI